MKQFGEWLVQSKPEFCNQLQESETGRMLASILASIPGVLGGSALGGPVGGVVGALGLPALLGNLAPHKGILDGGKSMKKDMKKRMKAKMRAKMKDA